MEIERIEGELAFGFRGFSHVAMVTCANLEEVDAILSNAPLLSKPMLSFLRSDISDKFTPSNVDPYRYKLEDYPVRRKVSESNLGYALGKLLRRDRPLEQEVVSIIISYFSDQTTPSPQP
jgi:hypothetical protein